MRSILVPLAVLGVLFAVAPRAAAHCQVPCGIYTDELRFQAIHEDIATIEKAMAQIGEIGASNFQQTVRWTMTKESHAQNIQDTVQAYFLTQRIKIDEAAGEDYLTGLRLAHHMLVYAMKCKQGIDPANAAKLREATEAFHDHYFKDKEHDHE